MKIVFMEAQSLGEDMDLSMFAQLGEVEIYEMDTPADNAKRIQDADVVVMNKIRMDEAILKDAKRLKLICVTATGTDCVDVAYAASRGIAVSNVVAYSTESVVQHTFAMLFYLWEKSRFYDDYVKSGEYSRQKGFGCYPEKFHELAGKTWGIIGMGNIGRRVAQIASCFGCRVLYYSTTGVERQEDFARVEWDVLLQESDVISIHAPLNDATRELINAEALRQMKKTAVLLNLGRGGIVSDADLVEALESGEIAAAGLDVLNGEPIWLDNPLNRIKDSQKLYITPHIAWATVEARTRCVQEVFENIRSYQNGIVRNAVKA
ncbi:MAG: D-2-hydroxyacid dehydrogenase [Eubacteriales bacterium]|nr:D-2-hydroxyacid dehydrogenase [Eubacteriales bacterium]